MSRGRLWKKGHFENKLNFLIGENYDAEPNKTSNSDKMYIPEFGNIEADLRQLEVY